MKEHVQQDERVLAQKRKIGSDAFNIIWMVLIISVLVQQYLFNAPITQYAVEIVLFIVASMYVIIRNLLAGNDLFASSKRGQVIVITNSIVCGLTVATIKTILNYAAYSPNTQPPTSINTALMTGFIFASATLITFIPLQLLYLVNKKKQKDIESRLDED